MSDNDLMETKIHTIIAKSKKIDVSQISNDTVLEELGIESLDMLVIISDIENTFDVDVPDDIGHSITTVGEVVAAIREVTNE